MISLLGRAAPSASWLQVRGEVDTRSRGPRLPEPAALWLAGSGKKMLRFGQFALHQMDRSVPGANQVAPGIEHLVGVRNHLQNAFGQPHACGVRPYRVNVLARCRNEPVVCVVGWTGQDR